jgi:outer membrane protein assembly factor BamB
MASWPMFRGGPSLLGVAAGSIDPKLSLLWSFKTEGPVKSSAAIVGQRVFIGSDDGNVYGLNLADGRKLWSYKTAGPVESSPLVLDGKVYVGSSDAWLYALDADTGKLVWKYETGDKILGSPNWVKSPKGDATWIVAGSYDFKLHCLDAMTGRSNWVYETGNYINGSPAVANGQTVFGGCDAILHVLSLADGTKAKEIEAGAYIAGSAGLMNRSGSSMVTICSSRSSGGTSARPCRIGTGSDASSLTGTRRRNRPSSTRR